jgi:hypothetical protein
VPQRLLPLLLALTTAGMPLPASLLVAFEASTRAGAVKLHLGWGGMPNGITPAPTAFRVVEVYEAVCSSVSGKQKQKVTRQTDTDPEAGDTMINGMAPVIGAPCENDKGEQGKWETVELASATSYPIRTR